MKKKNVYLDIFYGHRYFPEGSEELEGICPVSNPRDKIDMDNILKKRNITE